MLYNGDAWRQEDPGETFTELVAALPRVECRRLMELLAPSSPGEAVIGARSRTFGVLPNHRLVQVWLSPEMLGVAETFGTVLVHALTWSGGAQLLTGRPDVVGAAVRREHAIASGPAQPPAASEAQVLEMMQLLLTFTTIDGHKLLPLDDRADLCWPRADAAGEAGGSIEALLRRCRDTYGWRSPRRVTADEARLYADEGPDAIRGIVDADDGGAATDAGDDIPAQTARLLPTEDSVEHTWQVECPLWVERGVLAGTFRLDAATAQLQAESAEKIDGHPGNPWEPLPSGIAVGRRLGRRLLADVPRQDRVEHLARLRHVRVAHSIDLGGCSFADPLDWDDVEIDGDLILEGATVPAGVRLHRVTVTGRVIARALRCGELELERVVVGGLYEPKAADAGPPAVGTDICNAQCGAVRIRNSHFSGGLNLDALHASGDVLLQSVVTASRDDLRDDATGTGGVSLIRAEIAGHLRVSGNGAALSTDIDGQLDLSLCRVGGTVTLQGLATRPLGRREYQSPEQVRERLDAAEPPAASEELLIDAEDRELFVHVHTHAASVRLTGASVGGGLLISCVDIGGSLVLSSFTTPRGIIINATRIGALLPDGTRSGVLDLSDASADSISIAVDEDVVRSPYIDLSAAVHVHGTADLNRCRIGTDLRLSGVRIEGQLLLTGASAVNVQLVAFSQEHLAAVKKGVAALRLRVERDMLVKACRVGAADDGRALNAHQASFGDLRFLSATFGEDAERTVAETRLGGHVDLSEATIASDLFLFDVQIDGSLHAARLSTGGDLQFTYFADPGGARGTIKGIVELAGSSIGQALIVANLAIAGDLGCERVDVRGPMTLAGLAIDRTLVLADAKLVSLSIRPVTAATPSRIDRGIDASGIHVGRELQLLGVALGAALPPGAVAFRATQASFGDLRFEETAFDGDAAEPHRCRCHGGVDLDEVKITSDLILRWARIDGDLNGRRCTIGGMLWIIDEPRAEPLTIGGSCLLAHATIGRNVALQDVRIGGRVDLGRAQIEGSLQVNDVACAGAFGLAQATVHDEITLLGVRLGTLSASSLRLDGDLLVFGSQGADDAAPEARRSVIGFAAAQAFEAFQLDQATIGGVIQLHGTTVEGTVNLGSIKLRSLRCSTEDEVGRVIVRGDLLIFSSTVAAEIALQGVQVDGDVNLVGSTVGGMVDANSARTMPGEISATADATAPCTVPTRIGGDVQLSGADVKSDVRFEGARVGGRILAITGTFNRVQIRPLLSPTGNDSLLRPSLGSILLQSIKMSEFQMTGTDVTGDVELLSVEVRNMDLASSDTRFLTFGDEESITALAPVSVPGPAAIRTAIGGTLRFRALNARSVVLSNVDVDRLEFTESVVSDDLAIAARLKDVADVADEMFEARIGALSLDRSVVHGDVVLDGATISRSLTARSAEVKGTFALSSDTDAVYLEDGAEVDLSGLSATKLILGVDQDSRLGVRLTGAAIGTLAFHSPPLLAIDASNADVRNWVFRSRDGAAIREGDELRTLLRATAPYDRLLYSNAERWLRQRGDEGGADAVFVDMRWRGWLPPAERDAADQDRPTRWRRLGVGTFKIGTRRGRSAVIGMTTGFWTAGARVLALASAITLPISLLVASVPANYAPSLDYLQTPDAGAAHLTQASAPGPGAWSVNEALESVVANHVPIIPVVTSSNWDLASHRPLKLGLPHVDTVVRVPWFTPAAYGLFVRLLFWIAWPLFLIGIAANVQRKRDSG